MGRKTCSSLNLWHLAQWLRYSDDGGDNDDDGGGGDDDAGGGDEDEEEGDGGDDVSVDVANIH